VRNKQLERQLRLLRHLQRGRSTLDQLAAALGVCTRTVRRDLEVLSVTGFPVRNERADYEDAHVWGIGHDGRCPVCERV
jgi:predicted DNA-binding transcriptional regulator YafY